MLVPSVEIDVIVSLVLIPLPFWQRLVHSGGQFYENFVNIYFLFSRSLQKLYSERICEILSLFSRDFPLIFQIAFITD